MEKYILENQDSFKMSDIFDCGQCFRWNKQQDGSFIGVIKDAVIKVEEVDNKIIFYGESNIISIYILIMQNIKINYLI